MASPALAASFEGIGDEYDRFRPGFPVAAAELLVPAGVGAVLDLGAGTGKFTRLLVERADVVIAVEPSAAMLAVLERELPGVDARQGSAERIPLDDGAVGAAVVAQAFHWFDRDVACKELTRVLTLDGVLGLVWNRSDPGCSWDHAAHRIAHPAVTEADGTTEAASAALPGFVLESHEVLRWHESLSRSDYLSRWGTVSTFLVADADERRRMTAAIEGILDADPRTKDRDILEGPHLTDVFRYRRA